LNTESDWLFSVVWPLLLRDVQPASNRQSGSQKKLNACYKKGEVDLRLQRLCWNCNVILRRWRKRRRRRRRIRRWRHWGIDTIDLGERFLLLLSSLLQHSSFARSSCAPDLATLLPKGTSLICTCTSGSNNDVSRAVCSQIVHWAWASRDGSTVKISCQDLPNFLHACRHNLASSQSS
jgi:hypothetical protein